MNGPHFLKRRRAAWRGQNRQSRLL